jgi:hypothetical protein
VVITLKEKESQKLQDCGALGSWGETVRDSARAHAADNIDQDGDALEFLGDSLVFAIEGFRKVHFYAKTLEGEDGTLALRVIVFNPVGMNHSKSPPSGPAPKIWSLSLLLAATWTTSFCKLPAQSIAL